MHKFLERASHYSDSGDLVKSALATATTGRIYVEARSFAQVTKLARSIPELNPVKVMPVPPEDILKISNFSESPSSSWPWARVQVNQSKWRWYVGDTGLITKIEGHDKKYLALIPRLGSGNFQEGQLQAPQALVSRSVLEIQQAAKTGSYGKFFWKGQMFSSEGLLLIDLDNIAVLPSLEPLPTASELASFRSTSLLSTIAAKMTDKKIAQSRMKTGDRVKVVSGTYLSLIGKVEEVKENAVAVYFPSQGIVEDIPKDTLRTSFEIGDQVRVLDGQNQGLVAWVTGISTDTLHVSNLDGEDHIEVSDLYRTYGVRNAINFSLAGPRREVVCRIL